jgi:phage/conjugal plasmid C-4 type zinc finger TraR family protein
LQQTINHNQGQQYMNNDIDQLDISASEEGEQAQAIAMIRDAQALDSVRQKLAKQRSQPSLTECDDCGEDIPEARRLAVPGVTMCIYCQTKSERFTANYRQPGANSE